jgi:hypothetical protein
MIWHKEKIGRLAMRMEDDHWVAYYAQPNTMDKAVFIAAIHRRFVENTPRKVAFMSLMKDAVGDFIQEVTGQRPLWDVETPAPEHER